MDLQAVMGQFFNQKGEIVLPEQLSLAGMSEMLYQSELQAGTPDRTCLRYWDYSESREGKLVEYSRSEINTRIKVVGARLQQVANPGDRVAILAGNTPEYLFGFIGSLYAGMIPIPLYDPNEPGHTNHLKSVFNDAQPSVVVTDKASAGAVRKHFAELPSKERPRVLSVDSLPDSLADSYRQPGSAAVAQASMPPLDLPAFLQYTSGSTRAPAGVILTNRSIMTNVLQIFRAARLKTPLRLVTWLPLHHDMGIILSVFVTLLGLPFDLMSPRDFIQQPKRWITQLSRQPIDEHLAATYTVVPNFALELAVRYGQPDAGEELDFSHVDGIIIGSEPVTEAAVEGFHKAFGQFGLDRGTLRPTYGLAEASLLVTTPQTEQRPLFKNFDRESLMGGEAKEVEKSENSVAFASVGQVVMPQALTIVDPETRAELPDGQVGELWAHGENVAAGYLNRDEDTAQTFRNSLGQRLAEGSRVEGAPDDNRWLATGDLGVIIDGHVYITGRQKDLIVIAGRNHYPQDIEATVQETSEHVRRDSVAAFSIDGENTEKLILLIERADGAESANDAAAEEAVRTAVSKHHGVTPDTIVFKNPREINRTSSGKIARRVARKDFLA